MNAYVDPAGFARAVLLESSDIPADMTLAQWRREKQAIALMSRARRRRLKRALRKRR
jgi:hypothetical protein